MWWCTASSSTTTNTRRPPPRRRTINLSRAPGAQRRRNEGHHHCVLLIALAPFAVLAQAPKKTAPAPAPVFHGIKLGVPIEKQLPACEVASEGDLCFDDSSGADVNDLGEDHTVRKRAESTYVGSGIERRSYNYLDDTYVTAMGDDHTVEHVSMFRSTGDAEEIIVTLKQKYGAPTSCTMQHARTGVGITVSDVKCTWHLSWGHIVVTPSDTVNTMVVSAWTNR